MKLKLKMTNPFLKKNDRSYHRRTRERQIVFFPLRQYSRLNIEIVNIELHMSVDLTSKF
jgi:hypothetical protein